MTTSDGAAVTMAGVGKRFRRYDVDQAPTLKRFVLSGFRRRSVDVLWALHDVTAAIPEGTTTGLIGQNGAGKSTLLRLIAGIGRPTLGRIDVGGRVGALLDLGKEFQPE